ncbi:uncharacterized protein [Nerophis lumbriciformis]|uniref:uncharacterized protein isoform X1 n=1 Tax=Nerophis lumbriciformis TaxID=546530 RepID=UPI002ADF26E0|nr:zinc finger protein 771-like isoform X1 [Nerophis lumbriciformis]
MCERTIAEYEEELCPTKEEKERQHEKHQVVLHTTDIHQLIGHQEECLPHLQGDSFTSEDPQPSHMKEEEEGECPVGQEEDDVSKFPLTVVSVKTEEHEDKAPESSQLHHSPNLNEEHYLHQQEEEPQPLHIKEEEEVPKLQHIKDPQPPHIKEEEEVPQLQHIKEETEDPQPPHIKEEEEEHSISQEGDHLEGLVEFPVTGVPVKSEDDEVKGESEEKREAEPPSSSSTQHMTTEADGDHCGGSQADKILAPLSDSEDTTSHSPDTDDEHSKDDATCHTDNTHLKCSHCHKTFKYPSKLKRHMRTHTGEKPFSCSVCGVFFAQGVSLKKHMRRHTGVKCSCSVCGTGFVHKDNLKRHMRTHTREKPFSCSICGLSFTRKDSLKDHSRTHTGEKPFSCSVCGVVFAQSVSLKQHMRRHTGVTFSCSMCGTGFVHKDNLKRHMRIHTGEKPFSCSICGLSFTRKAGLKDHKCAGENSSSKIKKCSADLHQAKSPSSKESFKRKQNPKMMIRINTKI